METIDLAIAYLQQADALLTRLIGGNSFTENLLLTKSGKYITEFILVVSAFLIIYESVYWGGIYVGLWEYHAKDIFTEIPVHCAHVYVRVNVGKKDNLGAIEQYYSLLRKSKFNILNWKLIAQTRAEAFELKDFIKYHFEFSPEDFELNPDPEYGSTIDHLRNKTIQLFKSSKVYEKYHSDFLSRGNVLIYDKTSSKINRDRDNQYLAKCDIHTGDTIDCVVLVP